MDWQEVCEHPDLQNLPFKIELTQEGKILMSPTKVYHSMFQGEIAAMFKMQRTDGKVLTKCAINTKEGVKVADVAWVSKDIFEIIKNEVSCSIAPEICIEVLSESNTQKEMEDKKNLYFATGAKEVWICSQVGDISFYIPEQEINISHFFPDFPTKIEL